MASEISNISYFPKPVIPQLSDTLGRESNFETHTMELIRKLANCLKGDKLVPAKQLKFEQRESRLADLAKQGALTGEQRSQILAILLKKDACIQHRVPFWIYPECPSRLLYFSPKLWRILADCKRFSKENALLASLSRKAYHLLTHTMDDEGMKKIHPEQLAEIAHVVTLLKIPELEKFYKDFLHGQIGNINSSLQVGFLSIKALYLFAVIWPADKEEAFSSLLVASDTAYKGSLQALASRVAIAREFIFFNQLKTEVEGKKWESFSPLQLYRFFFYIHKEAETAPSLRALRLEAYGKLLTYMRNGEFDADCHEELIDAGENSSNLRECLTKNILHIKPIITGKDCPISKQGLAGVLLKCNGLSYDSDQDAYELTSCKSETLMILKDIGGIITRLLVHVNSVKKGPENSWEKIIHACPNLDSLGLIIQGPSYCLASLSLGRFSHLMRLLIVLHDSEGLKALQHLRIPSCEFLRIGLLIKIEVLNESYFSDFIDRTPKNSLKLGLFVNSSKPVFDLSNLLSKNPAAIQLSRLQSCKEIMLFGGIEYCFLIKHILAIKMQHLESIELYYQGNHPSVHELTILKNELPSLKTYNINSISTDEIDNSVLDFLCDWKNEQSGRSQVLWDLRQTTDFVP